jgi:hypothetical protein
MAHLHGSPPWLTSMAHLHGSPPWLTSMISYHIAHLHDHLTARIKPYTLGTFSILGTNAFGESVNATFGQSTEHKISLNRIMYMSLSSNLHMMQAHWPKRFRSICNTYNFHEYALLLKKPSLNHPPKGIRWIIISTNLYFSISYMW